MRNLFLEQSDCKNLPERQSVVSNKSFTLPNQEGAIRRSSLVAVIGQQPLSDLSTIPPSTKLPVEPFFCHMLVHSIGHLEKSKKGGGVTFLHQALKSTNIQTKAELLHCCV